MRVTDLDHVFPVIDTVLVLVDPDDVAGLCGLIAVHESVTGSLVVIYLLLVLEDTLAGEACEIADRLARTGLEGIVRGDVLGDDVGSAVDDALGVVDVEDLVLIVRAVDADAVHQVADAVVPGERKFDALVAHGTAVDGRSTGTILERCGSVDEPVLGVLAVPVEGHTEPAAEESGVEAYVGLLGGLPSQFRVRDDARIGTGLRGRSAVGEVVRGGQRDCGGILEVVDGTVTVLAPAATDLEVVDDALGPVHEVFVGDDPAGGCGREITPAMAGGEVLRTVRTEDEGQQVGVPIIVVGTSEEGEQVVVRDGVAAADADHCRVDLGVTGGKVGGLPGLETGVLAASVHAHSPLGAFDGGSDEGVDVMVAELLRPRKGILPGITVAHGSALGNIVELVLVAAGQLVCRRPGARLGIVEAISVHGTETPCTRRGELDIGIGLEAVGAAFALAVSVTLEKVVCTVALVPSVALLVLVGVEGAVGVVGREERSVSQCSVDGAAVDASGADSVGVVYGNGGVLTELQDVAAIPPDDGVIGIGADGVAVVPGLLRIAEGSFGVGLGITEREADEVVAAVHSDHVVVDRGVLVHGLAEPVGTIPGAGCDLGGLDREVLRQDFGGRFAFLDVSRHGESLVGQVDILLGTHGVNTVEVSLLDTPAGVEGDVDLAVALALLGGHENDAVGGTGTVDGRGGGILQDVDGLDVSGVERTDGAARHAVDDVKGAGGTGRTQTADGDRIAVPGLAGGLHDVHARNGTVEGSDGVGGLLLFDEVSGDADGRSGDETLALGTVTDDDGLVKFGRGLP